MDPLDELIQFLKPESRIDLKHIAIDHLVGLSGTEEGIKTLLKNEQIIQQIIELTDDKVDEIAKNALLLLVNLTANALGAKELIKFKPNYHKNLLDLLIGYVLNPDKKDADAACMILCNLTRLEDELESCLDTFIPHLNDLLNAFIHTEHNRKGSNLNYLSPMFSNLSRSAKVQKWFVDENPFVPLIKLLPFCNYNQSNIRKGGAIGTVRNIAFSVEHHDFLLSNDIDLLTYLLNPLMGNEDFIDEEMDVLPIALQYLPKEKCREADVDIRKMILETLNKLCSTMKCREVLRNNGVYYVMREYHKWEKDPKTLLACENIVDILIKKEEEIGVEDYSKLNIPEDMIGKFEKMDEDYIKSVTE